MGRGSDTDLPAELLVALPSDPFELLEIARKITVLAVTSRVKELEAEATHFREQSLQKDTVISGLQERVGQLQQALQQCTNRLSSALDEQEKLTTEKNGLLVAMKKLNRDVAKLESFKKTLMLSLKDDDEIQSHSDDTRSTNRVEELDSSLSSFGSLKGVSKHDKHSTNRVEEELDSSLSPFGSLKGVSKHDKHSTNRVEEELDSSLSPFGSLKGVSKHDKHSTNRVEELDSSLSSFGTLKDLTPQLASSASPKILTTQSAMTSPRGRSGAVTFKAQSTKTSPRWQSVGEGRFSLPQSLPTSHHSTAPNSPPNAPAWTPRVDAKEFFRQVRNCLSYEQFSAFLGNIKELNSHKQTREETLKKADEIFGPNNKDLLVAFDGLLSRQR